MAHRGRPGRGGVHRRQNILLNERHLRGGRSSGCQLPHLPQERQGEHRINTHSRPTIHILGTSEPRAFTGADPSPSPTASNENITVENNKEFRALLENPQPDAATVEQFAAKHKGRTIEFDGNVANVASHNGYKTRFDFLIYAGDYSADSAHGPNFQFANCAYYNLHLTGDNIPNSISAGQNLHIVAKIIDFNSTQELLHLEPIATSAR